MFSKKSKRTNSSYKMFLNESVAPFQSQQNLNVALGMNYTQNPSNQQQTFSMSSNSSFAKQKTMSSRDTGIMTWGEPTWSFFHTMAEKVNDDTFASVREDILKYIYIICINLPCPECAQHARAYLSAINFNAIQTKAQLKDMLYLFHNEVNKRKGVTLMERNNLDSKYAQNVLSTTFYVFLVKFKDKHASIRMISDDMYRAGIAKQLATWFSGVQSKFEI